jgi:hypothetical protein
MENLKIKSIFIGIMVEMYSANCLPENKSDEELLAQKTKENKERIIRVFDEVIEGYREATEREEKYKKNTKEYKDYSGGLEVLSKLKERILSLSELDGWNKDNEGEKIGEAFIKILGNENNGENNEENNKETKKNNNRNNNRNNNSGNTISLSTKFLEFQQFYNREFFETITNNLMAKHKAEDDFQWVTKLRKLKVQIEFNNDLLLEDYKDKFIKKQINFLLDKESVSNKEILLKKQIVLNFLYEKYNSNGNKSNDSDNDSNTEDIKRQINKVIDYKIKELETTIEEKKKKADDEDLYWDTLNIEYLNNIRAAFNSNRGQFDKYAEDLATEDIADHLIIKYSDAEFLLENKYDEEYLIKKAKKNKRKVEEIFDRTIEKYQREAEKMKKRSEENKESPTDFRRTFNMFFKIKERALILSEFDNWNRDNEREKIEETIIEVLGGENNKNKTNNKTNNERLGLCNKFLEFQYVYNKSCFHDVIDKLTAKAREENNMDRIAKLNYLEVQIFLNYETTFFIKDFLAKKRVNFLRNTDFVNEKGNFPKKKAILSFLYEEYNNNNDNNSLNIKECIDEYIEKEIEEYETSIREKRKNCVDDIELYCDLYDIAYLNSLHTAFNCDKKHFDEYLEDLKIRSIFTSLRINYNKTDYSQENKLDEEFLAKKIKQNKGRTTKIFDDVILLHKKEVERQRKHHRNTDKYKNYETGLDALIKLKDKLLTIAMKDVK